MARFPGVLTESLNDLGLSNYEASVYAALVLYDNAEAKKIIDILSISKPSVYEALDSLSEKGLAVKRASKPARYSPISPDTAIEILLDKHRKAADLALMELKKLEKEKVRVCGDNALWTIYGDTNIGYKIRDMLSQAKKHIECMIGQRYLPLIENLKLPDVRVRLIVVSGTPDLAERLREKFPGKNVEIHVVSPDLFNTPPPFAPPGFDEAKKFMNFENVLELNVDDEETIMVPPFIGVTGSVLNTRNKSAIMQFKMFSQMHTQWLLEGKAPCPPPGKPRKKQKGSGKP
ncbi:MAG: hypothetical protein LUQ13_04640 [Methanomicrobiales archaeon]|nr:hypothetical protein [Methanomicrobiales archaeon]